MSDRLKQVYTTILTLVDNRADSPGDWKRIFFSCLFIYGMPLAFASALPPVGTTINYGWGTQ